MKKKNNNKGFSLIELIIAIAILVILTGLLAPQFMKYMEKARESKDMQALDSIYGAVQTALADEKAYNAVVAGKVGDTADSLAALKTKEGMTLTALLADGNKENAFVKEFKTTLGIAATATDTGFWSSGAVISANGKNGDVPSDAATYIQIEPATLKVTVWIGEVGTILPMSNASALNPTTEKTTAKLKTVGATFYISK